ncbi:hypothetical protein SERLA73DRAFT_133119 [Serpula lacrymans var. lacrymans S7.3]|uniref:Uncharacterized protein n=2 Tax=Serpula lacrymans var. lacrymans TaxID=341189 RepID=F8PQH1_SERL3|nr:uncharacterized protein SERLADRAFT_383744 [Serpula lacrymans var. lacrymans S7.9]EGO02219.1 hypothetical protein SERLA73DRAFT_133119 [Serpula lacrymans var. lacrymans S7.3]EGO27934.1 hypothetical protein SERLADRAFT_383744 [Serpula lacrymans var. lacrymans S7.9]
MYMSSVEYTAWWSRKKELEPRMVIPALSLNQNTTMPTKYNGSKSYTIGSAPQIMAVRQ